MIVNENLFLRLRAGFPAVLDGVAIETETGLTYSWRDLDDGSAMLANLLESLELPPASRIAVQVEKSVEALMLYLATLRAGHVYLPLNTAYQPAELEHFIRDAEPAIVVGPPRSFGWMSKLGFAAGVRNVFTLGDDRTGSLLTRAGRFGRHHEPRIMRSDDLAAILYTSGTTGRSKGAMLTHGNLAANAATLDSYWGWRHPDASGAGGDVLIHALPIFHVHGLFVAIHGALLAGARMIWFGRFDPETVCARLPDATIFMGVPTLYTRLLAEPALTTNACRHMRLFISGSAPLLPETFAAFQARTGHTILERYGMSETVMLTSNPYRAEEGDRRAGTVGFALPGVEVRVTGDDGQALPPGEVGGIEVRGPSVFKGYWRMPEKTQEEFTDGGWFKTGDVGRVDDRGYLRIVGRSKDLIISGGYNVYPAEIESAINALPGVAESAVVGVPHPDFGEVGVAIVAAKAGVPPPSPHGILASLKGGMANFKVPKHCEVVEDLPRNAMGKVQKNLLRDRHRGRFA